MSVINRAIGFLNQVAYSTWNPSDKSANITLSNGNLKATAAAGGAIGVRSTTSKTNNTGKFYFELTVNHTNGSLGYGIGIAISGTSLLAPGTGGGQSDAIGYSASGDIYNNGGVLDSAPANYTDGDVIGVALDTVTSGWVLTFYKNNVQQSSRNLNSDGVTHDPDFIQFGTTSVTEAGTLNVGASAFVYTPPAGYSAWG
jgi:hypothetical protein